MMPNNIHFVFCTGMFIKAMKTNGYEYTNKQKYIFFIAHYFRVKNYFLIIDCNKKKFMLNIPAFNSQQPSD